MSNTMTPAQAHLNDSHTVRSLLILSDDEGPEAPAVAFPTRLDLERQLTGATRQYVAQDVKRFYTLEHAGESPDIPRQLNAKTTGGKKQTTFLWLVSGKHDGKLRVVKASYLVEAPFAARAAFTFLCQKEGASERGEPFDAKDLLAIGRAIRYLNKLTGYLSGQRVAKDTALSVLGHERVQQTTTASSSSSSAAASAAAAAAAGANPSEEEEAVVTSSEHVNDILGNFTFGSTFFGRTCVAVARRMSMRMYDLKPDDEDEAAWGLKVSDTFGPWISRMENLDPKYHELPRAYARCYDNAANTETINDVVAGGHATFLHVAGIAPALCPMSDYFVSSSMSAININTYGGRMIYSVYPYYQYSLMDIFRAGSPVDVNFARPNQENMNLIRSILAQILTSLSSAQHVARYVHYDLHASNIRCDTTRSGMVEYGKTVWRYRVPVGHSGSGVVFKDVVVPASDSRNTVMRIIDHGRSRIDRPGMYGMDVAASRIESKRYLVDATFDPCCDVRTVAHDFVFYVIPHWVDTLQAAVQSRETISGLPALASRICQDVVDLADVLEEMTSFSSWEDWKSGPYFMGDATEPLDKPATFMEYAGTCMRPQCEVCFVHPIERVFRGA